MNTLQDLLDFVKTRMPEGASFSDIRGYLEIEDKIECQNLIQDALSKRIIYKTGEKRGTRYTCPTQTVTVTENGNEIDEDIHSKDVEAYLNDPRPIYSAVIVKVENIIKFNKPKNMLEFIQNGRRIIHYTIEFDSTLQKNVIAEKQENTQMNYFVIRGKEHIIEKHDLLTNVKTVQSFAGYEELREDLRVALTKHLEGI